MRVRLVLIGAFIALVGLLMSLSPPAGASPAGRTYNTSSGDMTWSSSSRATYNPTQNGTIVGTLSGRTFTGRWNETTANLACSTTGDTGTYYWGNVIFNFNEDFTAFTGSWTYCNGGVQGSWNGSIPNVPTPTPTATPRPTPRPTPTPVPKCDGKTATISGSGVIVGTSKRDIIVGSSGPDTIRGGGGRDLICGRGGNDTIYGGGKKDVVYGQGGADTIYGGKGPDILNGGGRGDTIIGQGGNDTANGGPGTDTCGAETETSCEENPTIPGPTVTWEVPSRYGKTNAEGLVKPNKLKSRFRVDFSVRRAGGKPCKTGDKVKVAVREFRTVTVKVRDRSKPCEITVWFGDEGRYDVKFTHIQPNGTGVTTAKVDVQDWLIVGIGDSNGSGEGVPDKDRAQVVTWGNRQCHRSGFSHQALTAAKLERDDDKTSVTFRHLACSGAQIEDGLLQPYKGITNGRALQPQLNALEKLNKKQEVDAVFISAGVNDLHFGEMVAFCVIWERCYERTWETFGSESLNTVMERNLSRLPYLYQQLNDRLEAAGIPSDRVYITEYFDSTTDENRKRCDPLIRFGFGVRDFDKAEADWAATRVLKPLNDHVKAAAARHGWNFVPGASEGFVGHGICAKQKTRWIVDITQSNRSQLDSNGALHANLKGNKKQRGYLVPVVKADLYQGNGDPRPAVYPWPR